jgi:hypothetical protein
LYEANLGRAKSFVDVAEAQADVFNFVLECKRKGVQPEEGLKRLLGNGFRVPGATSTRLAGTKRTRSPHSDADRDEEPHGNNEDKEHDFPETEDDEEDEINAGLDRALDDYLEQGNHSDDEEGNEAEDTEPTSTTENTLPPNFCHRTITEVDFDLGYIEDFNIAHCDISEGHLLYIPAGWFHEVFSSSFSHGGEVLPRSHMAFNYWMHPPATNNPDSPYVDDYLWKRYCRLRS